jgi:hypothetical protein
VLVSAGPGGQAVPVPLTDREMAMLDFERTWWTRDDSTDREPFIRHRFQCSGAEYYDALNRLLERPEALAHDPLVVRRLLRARDRLRRQRLDQARTGEMSGA